MSFHFNLSEEEEIKVYSWPFVDSALHGVKISKNNCACTHTYRIFSCAYSLNNTI